MAKLGEKDRKNAVKLDLRRRFMTKYHADGSADVLDCCQGDGFLWQRLRTEFKLAGYWGVDKKGKVGRLKIDSVRLLSQPGWSQNVIDIDTHGQPWKHYAAMLPHVVRPVTVFMSLGNVGAGVRLTQAVRESLGFGNIVPPAAMNADIMRFAVPYLLNHNLGAVEIAECVEASGEGTVRYIGLRLVPRPKRV